MANMIKVTGIKTVLANIDRMNSRFEAGAQRGVKLVGVLIGRESAKIVPVQIGNLKASRFERTSGNGFRTRVDLGYTAKYAVFVHENLDATHGKEFNVKHAAAIAHAKTAGLKATTAQGGMFNRGKNQQAKFLEKPIRENRKKSLKIIHQEMKL